MSRTFMKQQDIPKYIRELLPFLKLTTDYEDESCLAGYTYRLYGKWKIGFETQLYTNAEKLVEWAKRYYADSFIVKKHFWYDDVPCDGWGGDKWHKQKAYREGFRNYITIVITDPVAKQIEIAKDLIKKAS